MKLKRILTCLLIVVFAFGILGCNVKGNPPTNQNVVDDYKLYLNETFNSTNDLSDCQGYRNWYYYCGDPENNTLASMVFNSFSGRWCSEYQNLDKETYIWGTAWLPSPNGGIGMGFKAPATGKLNVKVKIKLLGDSNAPLGDGVVFTMSDYNGEAYDGKSIQSAKAGIEYVLENTISVKINDSILFMLFANTNNTNDYTSVDITIKYLQN